MRKLALALLSLLALPALAAEVTVSWEMPTTRVDGTALPVSQLAKTVVEYGTCGTQTIDVVEGSAEVASPATTLKFQRAPGQVCVRAYVVDTDGRRSDNSGTVMATIESDANPGAPIILQIALLPLPPQNWEVYSVKGYQNTTVRIITAEGIVKAPGSNLVAVGSPCNCLAASYLDADGLTWCSVEGQIQLANNTASGGVPKGQPFPAGYGATCRAAA